MDFQSLWDLQAELLYDRLGKDSKKWISCLLEIRNARKTFDTRASKINFGPIVINYSRVQSKVNLKYDAWHKDVINKFGSFLTSDMHDLFSQIQMSRTNLESYSTISTASTTEAVSVITDVQTIRKKAESWKNELTTFVEGQKILERQRYRFPQSWMDVNNINVEFSSLMDILSRRENIIQEQIANLRVKIDSEDQVVEQRTKMVLVDWENEKPITGSIHPEKACRIINTFESRMQKLEVDHTNIFKAKGALDMDLTDISDERRKFDVCMDELKDLKQVWSELLSIWKEIDELRDIQWTQVNPRVIRSTLDELSRKLKQRPARMRNYAPFEYTKTILENYVKINILIVDLKSESIKDRHWRILSKSLNLNSNVDYLTLGNVWDADLQLHEKSIKEVMIVAQGEKALEEFLRMVSETWKGFSIELVQYQEKCKIVKAWNDIIDLLQEHLNSLSAMKNSPYFKEFSEDANYWENKLERIKDLIDVWMDVQRRWIYLDGIFSGAGDISSLLPIECQRFRSVNSDFTGLMQKVSRLPLLIDILAINGIERTMNRLLDILIKIQKALSEYLERERQSFPRFYFVGDDDLLEIIGNAKDLVKIQRHLKKMFAGVHSLIFDSTETIVCGVMSKEGEEVTLSNQMNVDKQVRINDWLTKLNYEIRQTLSSISPQCCSDYLNIFKDKFTDISQWLEKYQCQIILLSAQVNWTRLTEDAITSKQLSQLLTDLELALSKCAQVALNVENTLFRRKLELYMIELVYQRDTIKYLIDEGVNDINDFCWIKQMRYYIDDKMQNQQEKFLVRMANFQTRYNFEYLGVPDKLIRTDLTNRCYLTMTQALNARLGGSPFGPAGTGKTETVKALGRQLGQFVLVFNCDQKFDFQAMGRIFIGLCQVGAWGCFDEFNRLDEGMMSAVSQQIQTIQESLKCFKSDKDAKIELLGREVNLHPNVAVFVTMNPGYAGRSNLPDNLKQLFRSFAMAKPDSVMIAQVMLYAQGFSQANQLAKKIVPLFELCSEQLSNQSHYDFGLRSLKNVLLMAGDIKRNFNDDLNEIQILVQAIMQSFPPRLIAADIVLFEELVKSIFPNCNLDTRVPNDLLKCIERVCLHLNLMASEESGKQWLNKVLQLHDIIKLNHGVMLVGNCGSGKTSAWKCLLASLNLLEKNNENDNVVSAISSMFNQCTIIDPKSMNKDQLYGKMDNNIREWKDGLFTHILRNVIDGIRTSNSTSNRHWIIFDGDVDPEWVENLNSVLDDNKVLTLPNGERLQLPSEVRILFEVQDLQAATLATVSRCGIVWFSDECVDEAMEYHNFLNVKSELRSLWKPFFNHPDGIVSQCLHMMKTESHIMDFTKTRALSSLFSFLRQAEEKLDAYNSEHMDFPISSEFIEIYAQKSLLFSIIWSFSGDATNSVRCRLSDFIRENTVISMPPQNHLTDYDINLPSVDWVNWIVPTIQLESHKVGSSDVIIPTVDTVKHENLVLNMLANRRPMILCGPPGSGKTMTMLCSLRHLPDLDIVSLNFSSESTPDLLIKSMMQYCDIKKTSRGLVMSPNPGRWVVLMCDEINLPDYDQYGTQCIISFIRSLIEQNGFYHKNNEFVQLERVQFVGACNPPTDPGRKPLSHRFLRHVTVLYVDYAGEDSLRQIYETFNKAILKLIPHLMKYSTVITESMIELYTTTQDHFNIDTQPHYIYSPRELTRWVRGISEAVRNVEDISIEGLIRIWTHEALRLFSDRLVTSDERQWTLNLIFDIVKKHFPSINHYEALQMPILYSDWLTKAYLPTDREALKQYVKARLKVFHEEELDVSLVLYDDLVDHILRIDRVYRQPHGHLLLIGVPGSGKITAARFVAWINGIKVVQLKIHNNYSMANFDDDLRAVLRRCGCKGEKIAFIVDEDSLIQPSFLERMNTLLANGEVPGLFEGDEYTALINQCKDTAQREGIMIDTSEELYRWFASEVIRNLHVVITMNPENESLKSKASASPALFNRCVVNWFGDWNNETLMQVAEDKLRHVDLSCSLASTKEDINITSELISNIFVNIHRSVQQLQRKLYLANYSTNVIIGPRHFLDFIQQFITLFNGKRATVEDHQLHLKIGLKKITETVEQVAELQTALAIKKQSLESKNEAASSKLQQMVEDQHTAEKQKFASVELKNQLSVQISEINAKTESVRTDLERVEPAVKEAKQAVQGIKKQHLVELRSLREPPAPVKMISECICLIMGQQMSDWKSIRAFIVADGFINSIVNFRTESISLSTREKIKTKYLSNPDFTFEKVSKGSHVCGPLYKWAIAQTQYAEMLNRVGPMRTELAELESKTETNKIHLNELDQEIAVLQDNIVRYREEYAELVREAQEIKSDLNQVENKVNRSISLLKSLEHEQLRWNDTTQLHNQQMLTIVGDVLLCSAFIAYCGYFDQLSRDTLWVKWTEYLRSSSVRWRDNLNRIEFLSTADQRLKWANNDLPTDKLCIENAIVLDKFIRYPLIIDPSELAVKYLIKELGDRKIIRTSFQDEGFRKQLESAMRFGSTLLVDDVESFDPLINPLLNKELHKISGRVLIRIGSQDIDFSPSFSMYLITRDPTISISPSLCSKVTIVNFTVTQMSMESQCLHRLLKQEKPDVERKQTDLAKLQGEFQQRLRRLENDLLEALNEQQGRILDDDSVIGRLEALKKEASDVEEKSRQTEHIMSEIQMSNLLYKPICLACSSIYFLLQSLNQIHHFYQYSLKFFMDAFESSLLIKETNLSPEERLDKITKNLFCQIQQRLTPGLLNPSDKVIGLMLCKIYAKTMNQSIDEYMKVLSSSSENDEYDISSIENMSLKKLLSAKFNEPHKLIEISTEFIEDYMQNSFFNPVEDPRSSDLKLKSLIYNEIDSSTPLMLCQQSGQDACQKVIQLNSCVSVAMGSIESCDEADKALKTCTKSGKWLILKNAHLSISWISQLEKKIHALVPHRDFRLFLTTKIDDKIPRSLIRISRVLMFEPPTGIIPNVLTVINNMQIEVIERTPKERCMIYLTLCWLHATIIERIRYNPQGWTKSYDFNESDLRFSSDVIDYWITLVSADRTNIQPEKIPWKAIITILGDCVYGGRIDNEFDKRSLMSFICHLFSEKIFNQTDYQFVKSFIQTKKPETAFSRTDLIKWACGLKDATPQWIGLCSDTNDNLMSYIGQMAMKDLHRLIDCLEENSIIREELGSSQDDITRQPLRAKKLFDFCTSWLDQLEKKKVPKLTNIDNALCRFISREISMGSNILNKVTNDLKSITNLYQNKIKHTNTIRELISILNEDCIPSDWSRHYSVPKNISIHQWISDFIRRIDHLDKMISYLNVIKLGFDEIFLKSNLNDVVDIGLMFNPRGFLTATRQMCAQIENIPIEELIVRKVDNFVKL